jgi:hypothetical protein
MPDNGAVEKLNCPGCGRLLQPTTAGEWPPHHTMPVAHTSPMCPYSHQPVAPIARRAHRATKKVETPRAPTSEEPTQ